MKDDHDSPRSEPAAAAAPAERKPFVVGVGASAGGLEALTELVARLSPGLGLPLIVVQHLEPDHHSLLVELLARASRLPVQWADHGRLVEPGQIYVARPRTTVRLQADHLVVEADGRKAGGAINCLFRSLAQQSGERAVGIILSGTGVDGVGGLGAIKAAGGIVFAQTPSTAAFAGMPQAAIDAGCVDRVLPPAAMADELLRLTQTSRVLWEQLAGPAEVWPAGSESEQLGQIFRLLVVRTGVDFRDYKQSTIKRRLVRRMILAKTPDLADYLKLLQGSREEVDLLYESLLINVTEFFRDADSFEFLRTQILPRLFSVHVADQSPIRIWVPGCATGEEVYTLGILLREMLDERNLNLPVQIFGTDISERAIATARAGYYSRAEVESVGPERLARHFYQTERGFVVQKPIRDMCVFARQNVVKDSPFSRLDLISCRNLLIYFGPVLQRRLMPIFHYALNPQGYLVLGSSESVGSHHDLFRLVDRRFRIYSRKAARRRNTFDFAIEPPASSAPAIAKTPAAMKDDPKEPFDAIREADRIVLGRHAPSGVLVNHELEILQFRGDVTPYLAPVEGRASLNLLRMAREGLAMELQAAVQEARDKNMRIQRPAFALLHGDAVQQIVVDVTPIDPVHPKERCYLVLFNRVDATSPGPAPVAASPDRPSPENVQIAQLRHDLQSTRSFLQATIEKHEATNQELRAANEEVQSSNEELQSTNEELETATEELQSTNEELTTVNEELHSRHVELMQLNNDLTNLITSVHLPIIILGQDMRIRRFTPMAERVLNVIPTDIGRPLSDININLQLTGLPKLIAEVIESLTIKEIEVQDNHGRWYSMRLRPYKTAENRIEGVVLTLIDIDPLKRTNAQLEETKDFAQAVIESTGHPMVALDAQLKIRMANRDFYHLFRTNREAAEGKPLFDVLASSEKLGPLRTKLEGVLPRHTSLTNEKVFFDLPGVGATELTMNVHQISNGERKYPLILLSLRQA